MNPTLFLIGIVLLNPEPHTLNPRSGSFMAFCSFITPKAGLEGDTPGELLALLRSLGEAHDFETKKGFRV